MKRMLFNATHSEEMRVAIVDGQTLLDMDIETTGKEQKKSNIYKGVITRIEPSLEAAFVDYGSERHGFLPFKEISRSYFNKPEANPTKVRIQDVMNVGQEVVVQVEKDERGSKGAALTTFISLAGRYLVLMPKNPRGGGVSRRIEGEERAQLRDAMRDLEIPRGMSIIARTAGIGRSTEELDWDLKYLTQLWAAIDSASEQQNGSFLIYQDASLVIRAIRDYFSQDIGEILIDNQEIFDQAKQFMGHVMPHNVNRVKLYEEDTPLFSRFQIEHQIQSAYARQVTLPSGGSIVMDHTEAMVAIDVNSARATRGGDIEETARRTNIEAAHEVAKQLRLRDLGGLVVIDFIDMESQQNQREVEDQLKEALHHDRARIQIGKISRFGLLELSRQRLQSSLGESSHITCPRCSGTGNIRSIESTALHVMRIVQDEAMKEHTAAVYAQVPVEVASYLLNEKRNELYTIENRVKVSCVLIPNIHLETPHFTVRRIRTDEVGQLDSNTPSYSMAEAPADEYQVENKTQEAAKPIAAVKGITPAQPAPEVKAQKKEGFFKRLLKAIFGGDKKKNTNDRRGGRRRDRFDNDRRRGRDGERRNRRDRNDRRRGRDGERRNRRSEDRDVGNSRDFNREQNVANNRVESTAERNQERTERQSNDQRHGDGDRQNRRDRNRRRRGDRREDRRQNDQFPRDSETSDVTEAQNNSRDNAREAHRRFDNTENNRVLNTAPVEDASESKYDSSIPNEGLSQDSGDRVELRNEASPEPVQTAERHVSRNQTHEETPPVVTDMPSSAPAAATEEIQKPQPIESAPVKLPEGMTMVETSSAPPQEQEQSTFDQGARDKAREERRARRLQKEQADGNASEPMMQVETGNQDDTNQAA